MHKRNKSNTAKHLQINSSIMPAQQKSIRKSTQQIYSDIFKAISCNYFEKTAIGQFMNKTARKNPFQTHMSICSSPGIQYNQFKGNGKLQQQFNQTKQINKFFKLADLIEDQRTCSKNKQESKPVQQKKQVQNTYLTAFIKKPIKINTFLTNLDQTKKLNRPLTSKYGRYKSACSKKNFVTKTDFKFVRIEPFQSTRQIQKLKRSINELQQNAINEYGMNFQKKKQKTNQKIQFDQFQENVNSKMDQIEAKLKQIKLTQKSQKQQKIVTDDCSIPSNYLQLLSTTKKTRIVSPTNTKMKSSMIYLRV